MSFSRFLAVITICLTYTPTQASMYTAHRSTHTPRSIHTDRALAAILSDLDADLGVDSTSPLISTPAPAPANDAAALAAAADADALRAALADAQALARAESLDLRAQIARLEAAAAAAPRGVSAEHDLQVQQLARELAATRKRETVFQRERDETTAKLRAASLELVKLRQQIVLSDQEKRRERIARAELVSNDNQDSHLQDENRCLRAALQSAQEQIQALQVAHTPRTKTLAPPSPEPALKRELGDAKATIVTLENSLAMTKRALQASEERVSELEKKLVEAEAAAVAGAEQEREIEELMAEAADMDARLAAAEAARHSMADRLALAEAEAQAARAAAAGAEGAIAAATAAASARIAVEVRKNRRLYDELQSLRGNVRVYARVRPGVRGDEVGVAARVLPGVDGEDREIVVRTPEREYNFEFTRAFGPEATQADVFSDIAPLSNSCLDGYSVSIFAYGQTGSGKTYTSFGEIANPEKAGVSVRALEALFAAAAKRSEEQGWEWTFRLTCMEIYNENIQDLLRPVLARGAPPVGKLEPKQTPGGGVTIPGLLEATVANARQAMAAIQAALATRTTSSTNMNAQSSRSHCVVRIMVQGRSTELGLDVSSTLNFIDLAGSERVARSGAEGQALKEAQAINTSLSALGQVITALAAHAPHVPYRNSKLTHVLADALREGQKVLMFCNIAPSASDASESLSSLKFAQSTNRVELGAAVTRKQKISS